MGSLESKIEEDENSSSQDNNGASSSSCSNVTGHQDYEGKEDRLICQRETPWCSWLEWRIVEKECRHCGQRFRRENLMLLGLGEDRLLRSNLIQRQTCPHTPPFLQIDEKDQLWVSGPEEDKNDQEVVYKCPAKCHRCGLDFWMKARFRQTDVTCSSREQLTAWTPLTTLQQRTVVQSERVIEERLTKGSKTSPLASAKKCQIPPE